MNLRSRLTYANVMSTLAFVIAVSGGIAYGATYVVSSNSQVAAKTISGHAPPTGKHANIIPGSISYQDIAAGTIHSYNMFGGLPCVISSQSEFNPDDCGDFDSSSPQAGVDCFDILDFTPHGAYVSIDSGAAGFPVAFSSTVPAEIAATGCPAGTNAVVTTYTGAGGQLHDEPDSILFW
jgi:hypothetical protein